MGIAHSEWIFAGKSLRGFKPATDSGSTEYFEYSCRIELEIACLMEKIS